MYRTQHRYHFFRFGFRVTRIYFKRHSNLRVYERAILTIGWLRGRWTFFMKLGDK